MCTHAHLVWREGPSVDGGHCPNDGYKGDHHDENVFGIHSFDVGEAPDDQRSQPEEIHCGKEKPNHLNTFRQNRTSQGEGGAKDRHSKKCTQMGVRQAFCDTARTVAMEL